MPYQSNSQTYVGPSDELPIVLRKILVGYLKIQDKGGTRLHASVAVEFRATYLTKV